MDQSKQPNDAFIHRQMESEARDIIAVHNPLATDYRLIFDRRLYIIPGRDRDMGKGRGVEYLQRFLADKFRREVTDLVLQEKAMDLVRAENKKRADAGNPALNKWEEQQVIESQINVNDPIQRQPVADEIWLGLVQKAPEDLLLNQLEENESQDKSPDEMIRDSLKNKVYTPGGSTPEPVREPEYHPQATVAALQNDLVQNDTQTENS